MPCLYQPRQIAFGCMHRHAAHGDGLAAMFTPRGQRNVERLRRSLGVIEEELEKIAHPVKEQAIPGLRLQLQILRHHRRRRFKAGQRNILGGA